MGKNTIGVAVGKFLPFHRGHLYMLLQASTLCDVLYVVVSQDRDFMKKRCKEHGIKEMPLELIVQWMHQELGEFDHIKIVGVDETNIPAYPDGWAEWSDLTKKELEKAGVPRGGFADYATYSLQIDYFFGSERGYEENLKKYFNCNIEYKMIDYDRSYVDISATKLVENIYKNWAMLPGSVRPHFVKKVLITGTESCGKTTIVQKLAKSFLTSWSDEYGKWYERDELGGYNGNWQVRDFETIAMRQLEQDEHAYRTANKVAFIDTDAVVTNFYLWMYLGKKSPLIDELQKEEIGKWDLVILLQPTVRWVDDGTRWNSDDETRWNLHKILKNKYDELGIPYIEIDGDYNYRFNEIIKRVENLLIPTKYAKGE